MKINLEAGPACDLSALTPSQRQRHEALLRELFNGVKGVHETPDGFSFEVLRSEERITRIVEWITLESLCCPFFSFRIDWKQGSELAEVTVSGPGGSKALLAGYLNIPTVD